MKSDKLTAMKIFLHIFYQIKSWYFNRKNQNKPVLQTVASIIHFNPYQIYGINYVLQIHFSVNVDIEICPFNVKMTEISHGMCCYGLFLRFMYLHVCLPYQRVIIKIVLIFSILIITYHFGSVLLFLVGYICFYINRLWYNPCMADQLIFRYWIK